MRNVEVIYFGGKKMYIPLRIGFIHPQYLWKYTDASLKGWGAVLGINKTGGAWSSLEKDFHINILELLAIYYALRSF